jgi:hemolysin III
MGAATVMETASDTASQDQMQAAGAAVQQPGLVATAKTAVQACLHNPNVKPRWRGVLHSYACAAMLSAGAILVLEAQTSLARVSALVYVTAAAFQFFISALYHTQHWGPGMHKLLQRIDHSAIYG